MRTVLIIQGGSTYPSQDSYIEHIKTLDLKLERMRPFTDWKFRIQNKLKDGYDVIMPIMPCRDNADYSLWKIMFEKVLNKINDVILVGHSLGGIFLVKYLSENNVKNNISQLHLVSTPFNDEGPSESFGGFIFDKNNLDNVTRQVKDIFIYHSEDDFVVKFEHANKFKENLVNSKLITLKDRGHLNQEDFPELVDNIIG